MIRNISVNAIIVGHIHFETIINSQNRIYFDEPGGSALYAAAGFNIWNREGGIVSKIGEDKPTKWKKRFDAAGLDTTGIFKIPRSFDQRRFFVIADDGRVSGDNPQKHFFERGQPLPKYLLGYTPPQATRDIFRGIAVNSISPEEIPFSYSLATNLLITPMDLYTHSMLPPYFRSKTSGTIVTCGSSSFMKPSYWFDFPTLIRGTDIFIATVNQLERLFLGKTDEIWEMVEFIGNCGVEAVCVYNQEGEHLLYDKISAKKYGIPKYDAQVIDPIGEFATFCGGFFGSYIKYCDPIVAAKMGSISAGFKIEGSTARYSLGVLPELAAARLETLETKEVLI